MKGMEFDHMPNRDVTAPRPAILLGALLVACLPATVAGQAPGYPSVPIGEVRAEYVAEVITQINEVQADWGSSWEEDDVEELVDMYWQDALLIPPDGLLRRGHDDLRAYFTTALPSQGAVEAFMLDFDASGGMSQVFGNYLLSIDGIETRGAMLTVFVRRGRDWKIRSQVFMPPS